MSEQSYVTKIKCEHGTFIPELTGICKDCHIEELGATLKAVGELPPVSLFAYADEIIVREGDGHCGELWMDYRAVQALLKENK